MPTKHPRHIVTEVGPVADAFARARRVEPDVHVRDLVLLGAEAIVERGRQAEVDEERRAAAIEELIRMTTIGDGIDHGAAEHVHEILGTPELRRDV
jgi:hypothetical protein